MNALCRSLLAEAWAMDPRHLERFASELAALPADAEITAAAKRKSDDCEEASLDVRDGVAHIPVKGVVLKHPSRALDWFGYRYTSTERTARQLGHAIVDDGVRSIVLDVDSPGGTVSGVQELADIIGAARQVKPVSAHISDFGASAAYWLASQASPVTANASGAVGSIGIYMTVMDMSRMAENQGVKVHVIASHELKGAGAPGAPVTDAQLANISRNVQSYANIFTAAIARGRGLSAEAAQRVSTGQVWIGKEAVELGLIDSVSSSEDAHKAAMVTSIPTILNIPSIINAPRGGAQEKQMAESNVNTPTTAAPVDANHARLEAENATLKACLDELRASQHEQAIERNRDRVPPAALDSVRKIGATFGDNIAGFESYLKGLPQVTRPERLSAAGDMPGVETVQPSAEIIQGERSLAKIFGQSVARCQDMQILGDAVEKVEYERVKDTSGNVMMMPLAVLKDGSRVDREKLKSRLGLKGALATIVFIVAAMLASDAQAALSAARATQSKPQGIKTFKMKASTTIYAGGMVMIDTNGLALPAAASASNHGVVGVATQTKTSASSGTYTIQVSEGYFLFAATSIAQANTGSVMYASADDTFDETQGANEPVAGVLVEYVSATSGWLYISPTIQARAFYTASDPLTLTGDLTLNGGASGLTFGAGSSSVVVPDNSATGLILGSSGRTNLLTIDSRNNQEQVLVTGYTGTTALDVAVGETVFVEGVNIPIAATHLHELRFCGNGPNATTTDFLGPVLESDYGTDMSPGGAGCAAKDSTTETTADAPIDGYYAMKPVAMVCSTACGTNDTMTVQLRSGAASVTGMTCDITLTGSAAQCTIRDASPATIAAGATMAVSAVNSTDDNCSAGFVDCRVWVTY